MLKSAIERVVRFCIHAPALVIALWLIAALGSTYYAVRHFAIDTDVSKLISRNLDWRQREIGFEQAFPGKYDSILVVLEAPTQELAAQASNALEQKLVENKTLFRSVQEGPRQFFERNALLFLSPQEVEESAANLARGTRLLTILATDQSLRGLSEALILALSGVQGGALQLDTMTRVLTKASVTVEDALAGKPTSFSWQDVMQGRDSTRSELRRFLDVRPVLDYSALEPGHAATTAIREAAAELDLAGKYQTRMRLTGPVPIADEEFNTVKENALINALGTIVVVLVILWLALKSPRIILSVFINLFVGLAATAAAGLAMVGALNPISVAFAVLFVGLGVDFGIQFAVRYRAARYECEDLDDALVATARAIGAPLTLAATAVAAAFFSFLPTAYRGLSELGQIAGVGMLLALVTSITLLPALLRVLHPAGEPEDVGYRALAPVDKFLSDHRVGVIAGTFIVVLIGAPLLYYLKFDFNPINLRSPNVESVGTFLDLRSDPLFGANAINLLVASPADAPAAVERAAQIPEVSRATSLSSFVPQDQDRKLATIRGLADKLNPVLSESAAAPASDADNIAALKDLAQQLDDLAKDENGTGAAAAKRLSAAITRLIAGDKAVRDKVETAFVSPLNTAFDLLRRSLKAEPITIETLPSELTQDWITKDGRARVEILPKGDPNNNEVLRGFARAVLAVFPSATGAPISLLESGHTVVRAFFEAGAWALVSIAILLWIVLGRFDDVLLTLVPLLLAGVVTLELCVLLGMPLNFANIIALPLLLGVGVAFKIYYIMAWRAGQTDLLQSSLTRAVIWSALTTATAFGSLWLSSHPGTSSMGKLLALALVSTMAAAVLFQPALMGKPREK